MVVLIALGGAMKLIRKKKHVKTKKKMGISKARDKKLVQLKERICDPSLTLNQRRMILLEIGKWRG